MSDIYIFGHKNPDTDSVTSAIALSYLKGIKKQKATPYILGEVNNETKFVLSYFKVKKPEYLNDVKLTISDLNYKKNCFLKENNTLNELYEFMEKEDITSVPICNDNNYFKGLVSLSNLLKIVMDSNYLKLNTSYDNILKLIKGKEVLKIDNEINGNIVYLFNNNYNLNNNDIVITDNVSLLNDAFTNKTLLVIYLGKIINNELINIAKKNKVNLITTSKDLLFVSKTITLSNYIKSIINKDNILTIDEGMYVNDFLTILNKYKYNSYPVVNKTNKVLGLLRREDVNFQNKKKVIMVDHNEYSQSVLGIEEADVIEIIDHHKVGNINSSNPINIRNMAVGSTNTILYEIYKEQKVKPPLSIAGLMLSGIISDTLMLNSPTTTSYDKKAVLELSKIAKVDPHEFSKKMFEQAASIKGKTIEELIYNDFKSFNIENRKIGIGQMTVIDYMKVLKDKDKYINVIEKISYEHEYDILAFCITDIINNNTYLLFNSKSKTIFETIFNVNQMEEGYKLSGIVSRKKQIIPLLMEELK